MRRITVVAILLFGFVSMSDAQFLTNNTLERVKKIGVGPVTAAAFTMEVDGRQYLITAKHVIATLKGDEGEVQIFHGKEKSETLKVKLLRCPDPVDIAVLVPEKQITTAHPLPPIDGNIVFSQDVFFVGYPYGDDALSTLMEETAVGFVRKATFSAQERRDGWVLYYLDGINNVGFSGGPVVFQDMTKADRPWQIAGVVSGYRNDLGEVVRIVPVRPEDVTDADRAASRIVTYPNGTVGRLVPTGDIVLNNSGIVRSYGIKGAVDLIKSSNFKGPEVK